MTTFGTLSIDEVHPLIDSTFGREPEYENRSAMYLKTCTAEVSSNDRATTDCSVKDTVRKDPAVHVSLSSDSLVKQPGNLAVSNLPGRAEKPTKFEPPTSSRRSCPHISEELQRRAIAP